jgi:hypothetical protein
MRYLLVNQVMVYDDGNLLFDSGSSREPIFMRWVIVGDDLQCTGAATAANRLDPENKHYRTQTYCQDGSLVQSIENTGFFI